MKETFIGTLILSLVPTIFAGCVKDPFLNLAVQFRGNDIDWPNANSAAVFKDSGRYVPRNVIATKMQISGDEAIVALPRLKPGVPITLGTVSLRQDSSGTIAAFPNWDIQEEGDCKAIQNAVDIVLDHMNVLWVLDSGIVNTLTQPIRRCPPKVLGINVKSRKVVKEVDLKHLMTSESHLQSLSVDPSPDGKLNLYIADAPGRAIISYDVVSNQGHRVALPPDVNLASSDRDVLFTNLVTRNGRPELLFTYLDSSRVFSITAENLRKGVTKEVITKIGVKPFKMTILGTDNKDHVFFRKKGDPDIYMWNTGTPFTAENFIPAQKGDDGRLSTQVVSGHKKAMWSLESNVHDFLQNAVPCSGTSMSIQPLLKPCDNPS